MAESVGGGAHPLPFQPQVLAGGCRRARGAAAVVRPSSQHCNGAAPDLLCQAATARPPAAAGAGGRGHRGGHLTLPMSGVFHSRSRELLGRSRSRTARGWPAKGLGVGQARGLASANLRGLHPSNLGVGWDATAASSENWGRGRAGLRVAQLAGVASGSVFLQPDESMFLQTAEQRFSNLLSQPFKKKMLRQHFLTLLSKPFWPLSQHSLHRWSHRPLRQPMGSTKKGRKAPGHGAGQQGAPTGTPRACSGIGLCTPRVKAPRGWVPSACPALPASHSPAWGDVPSPETSPGGIRSCEAPNELWGLWAGVHCTRTPGHPSRRKTRGKHQRGLCKALLGTGSFLLILF